MDDGESFELRVNNLFGKRLFESVPNGVLPSSSWSVANGDVERVEWDRGGGDDSREREEIPCASTFTDKGRIRNPRGFKKKKHFEEDLDELDDDTEAEEDAPCEDEDHEETEIRSSVGLDPTLDNEEEEDQYDRAAFLREDDMERVYMRDVKDHDHHLNYHSVVSDSFQDPFERIHLRDLRADHFAARVRLREDDQVAGITGAAKPQVDPPAEVNLKPILKRKGSLEDSRPKKHVRFDPVCGEQDSDVTFEEAKDVDMAPHTIEPMAVASSEGLLPTCESSAGVPDYVRNPSKYTCYSFDSLDNLDDWSNKRAFEGFQNLKEKNQENTLLEPGADPPGSIIFSATRKEKAQPMSVDDGLKIGGAVKSSQFFVGVAGGDQGMEEDDRDANLTSSAAGQSKADRRYRSRPAADD